jgi:tetratricopeptide (TPR) repeat protein
VLAEGCGQLDGAIGHAQRALALDPLSEQSHRILIHLHDRNGDRASALAQFAACERVLREGLDVAPSAETRRLRDAVLADRAAPAGPPREPRPVPGRLPTPSPRYRLIGREVELRRLWRQVEATLGRGARFVIVQGEAGIGKSRLVEELLVQLAAPQRGAAEWTVLVGHGYQDGQGLPYHPVAEALRAHLTRLTDAALGPPEVWLAEVNRLLPEIGLRRPGLPDPPQLDLPQQRRRLFEGIAQVLAALGRPRLFVLEDLHWADAETLHLLAYLVRHGDLSDSLFLATLRSEDVGEDLQQILVGLDYEGRLDRLDLLPLSPNATAALVREVAAQGAPELAEQAYREAEGNPLFTIELVRALLEADPGDASPADRPAVPATIQAVIRGRLARLDPASRDFLNAAAVFRRAFDFDEARLVAGQGEETALGALEALLGLHVLRETAVPLAPGLEAGRYRFGHDQIRRAVYEGLSDARRRLLHRRALDLLAPAGVARAEELAYHASRGQEWPAALEWAETAAADAARLFAHGSAVHLYEQALACAAQLPPTPELGRRTIDLRVRLARTAFYVDPGRLMEWLTPAEAAAAEVDDTVRLAQVRLAQAGALYIQGQFGAALPRLEQLREMADASDDPLLRAQSDNLLGRLLVIRGELSRGLAALERALAAAEPASRAVWPATALERLVSFGLAACAHAFRGDFAAAADPLGRARELAAPAPGQPLDAAAAAAEAFYRLLVDQTRGDWAATVAQAREAIAHAHAAANLIYEYVSHVYLGLALARQGQVDEGLETQRRALALAERARTRVILGRAHAWLGEVLLVAGRDEAAYDAAARGEALSEAHGFLLEGAMCARVRGEACTALGAWEEAAEALLGARERLGALEAWPEWARAEAALGRLGRARGDEALAAEHLARAAERFAAMGMAWDLARTRGAAPEAAKGRPDHRAVAR